MKSPCRKSAIEIYVYELINNDKDVLNLFGNLSVNKEMAEKLSQFNWNEGKLYENISPKMTDIPWFKKQANKKKILTM